MQAPDQPAKVEPELATGVSVTEFPLAKVARHTVPQDIPAGLLVTLPVPFPDICTVNTSGGATTVLNVAVSAVAAVRFTVHFPVPVHAPDHPANVEFASATAVNVIAVPLSKLALHVPPQSIPAGLLVIAPVPVPALCTASWYCGVVIAANVAVTDCPLDIFTVQFPVPEHAPLHPEKDEPEFAVADRVTDVAPAKVALQVLPQFIPDGALVTAPAPETLTASR